MNRMIEVGRTLLMFVAAATAATIIVLALGGCAGQEASMQGFDLLESVAANVDKGVDEYHTMRVEQVGKTREAVAAGFASDVVALAGDKAKVEAKVREFVAAQAELDVQKDREQARYDNMRSSTKTLRSVTNDLRSLNELKLGWKPYVAEYVNRLRARLAEKEAK